MGSVVLILIGLGIAGSFGTGAYFHFHGKDGFLYFVVALGLCIPFLGVAVGS